MNRHSRAKLIQEISDALLKHAESGHGGLPTDVPCSTCAGLRKIKATEERPREGNPTRFRSYPRKESVYSFRALKELL